MSGKFCETCGREKKWFMHNCKVKREVNYVVLGQYGCLYCDDTCVFCESNEGGETCQD